MNKLAVFLVGALLAHTAHSKQLDAETRCLAKNIYWEARGEPWQGQVAVALVTLNRVKHPSFPNSICKVVYQPNQFSWTRTHPNAKINDGQAWQHAVFTAQLTKHTLYKYSDFAALYYHSRAVRPLWARKKRQLARIGQHIFYM